MRMMRMFPSSINERYIDELTDALRDGKLIIYPTDTVYAIGCDAMNSRAIERVCRIKDIDPRRQHLSITCADISQAAEYARIDNNAFALLRRSLPGPFTFILPASTTLPKVFKGRKEVGIRVPDNAIARRLAQALGHPLLTTTVAWEEADDDITIPEAIERHYEALGVDFIIDAGEGGTEGSTIVNLTDSSAEPEIIRQGKGTL